MANPTKNFLEHWRRVGPELQRVRDQELRDFNYEEEWRIIDSLLELGVYGSPPETSSGLVELQRLLARARR